MKVVKKQVAKPIDLINESGCFDLQFRKDTRHERNGSPTYYRWKMQFIVTVPKSENSQLKKIKQELGCGQIHIVRDQARFSVQKMDDIYESVVPFFRNNKLSENKKKDFALWQKAAEIIYQNKGIYISKWKKNDLHSLIEIHKSTVKYKQKPRTPKWLEMAKTLAKTI